MTVSFDVYTLWYYLQRASYLLWLHGWKEAGRPWLPLIKFIAADPWNRAVQSFYVGLFFGGTLFSLVEKAESIPDGIWWSYVSMTTVGYGDIAPKTTLIRFMAAGVILSGVVFVASFQAAVTSRAVENRIAMSHTTPELHDDFGAIIVQFDELREQLVYATQVLKEREDNMRDSLSRDGALPTRWQFRRP